MRGTIRLLSLLRWPLQAALLVGMGVIPAETIVSVRGVRVLQLGNRGLAVVEPGHYRDSISDGQCLLYADTVLVVAVAPPGQPNDVSHR